MSTLFISIMLYKEITLMSNDLAPNGTRFVSRKDPMDNRKQQWCLIDKKSKREITEYRNSKSVAKKDYFSKYKNGHEDRGPDV